MIDNSQGSPPLKTRMLGRTSVRLPELGFGAASCGNLYREISTAQASSALKSSLDAGITYIDTAPFYGFGLSERRVGDAIRERPIGSVTLSTKVGRLLSPIADHEGSERRHGFCSPMPFEPRYDYSYDGIMRSYAESLQRLGVARIDILLAHDLGEVVHGPNHDKYLRDFKDSGYAALSELRDSGQVGAIGLGVNEWQICETVMDFGQFDCFFLAGRYTLLEQTALDSFFSKCASHGASVIIGGAYNSGILATGVRNAQRPNYNYTPAPKSIIDRVAAIEDVCIEHDVPLPAAALQFPNFHPQVSSVVVGLDRSSRVQQTVDLYQRTIPTEFWHDLKERNLLSEDAPTP